MVERKQTENSDEAPKGTYDFLKRLGNENSIYNDQAQHRGCSIIEERFCPETGGSCIDIQIKQNKDGAYTELHAHITNGNRIFTLEGNNWNPRTGERNCFTPNLNDMIDTIKDIKTVCDTNPQVKNF